ncbi:hypothetical protein [Helicobacter acinonychis]|uniref:Uncharacterized protein n=1 Tax=Helicobacter acinonychis (strain Sheeba) TaxID=382638 RepID=Q17VC1_HELAH|nr:hypothetical protein [Helicobacter acinonychis]CAK00405.1 hypothetical protein with type IV secretory domain [Helicobacter acinonychis str. Sheeba]STP05076.1 VirB6 type IV secretion protein [Helicobacter acinonychis]
MFKSGLNSWILLGILGVLLITLYAFKRFQSNDLFEAKTFATIIFSLNFYLFTTIHIHSDNKMHKIVVEIVEALANLLGIAIDEDVKSLQQQLNVQDVSQKINNKNIVTHATKIFALMQDIWNKYEFGSILNGEAFLNIIVLLVIFGLQIVMLSMIYFASLCYLPRKAFYFSLLFFMIPSIFFSTG